MRKLHHPTLRGRFASRLGGGRTGSRLPRPVEPLKLNAVKAPTPIADRLAALPALWLLTLVVGCQSGPRPAEEFVQQADLLHQAALRQAPQSVETWRLLYCVLRGR